MSKLTGDAKDILKLSSDFSSASGAEKKKYMKLVPADAWYALLTVADNGAGTMASKLSLAQGNKSARKDIRNSFRNYYEIGFWIWIAEQVNDNPQFSKHSSKVNLGNPRSLINKWDDLMDKARLLLDEDVIHVILFYYKQLRDIIEKNLVDTGVITETQYEFLAKELEICMTRGYLFGYLL